MKKRDFERIKIIAAENLRELADELSRAERDGKIRVIILSLPDETAFIGEKDRKLSERIENFPKPLILTIEDRAEGFVFEILLAAHLCYAAPEAVFKLTGREKTARQIGSKNAGKLASVEGEFDAETALDLGLVNEIAAAPSKAALETAERIAGLAPVAVRFCLQAVNRGLEGEIEEGLELELELFRQIFATEDMREGTSAFFEKRKAEFKGR